jgi:hypothetical protein
MLIFQSYPRVSGCNNGNGRIGCIGTTSLGWGSVIKRDIKRNRGEVTYGINSFTQFF